MTLRSGHGTGSGQPRIETLPFDELPGGVPADARPSSPHDRGPGGRFAAGNALARAGGQARAGSTRLARRLGLAELPMDADFAPYRASAVAFRRAQCAHLAATVGGGICGPGPSSIVATASLQLAWARFLSDRAAQTGDAELAVTASNLGNASAQNLAKAHEYCAKEAKARPRAAGPLPWMPSDAEDDEEAAVEGVVPPEASTASE